MHVLKVCSVVDVLFLSQLLPTTTGHRATLTRETKERVKEQTMTFGVIPATTWEIHS